MLISTQTDVEYGVLKNVKEELGLIFSLKEVGLDRLLKIISSLLL